MKNRIEIKYQAKQNFHLNYGICLGAFILFVLISNPIGIFNTISNMISSVRALDFLDMLKYNNGISANTGIGLSFGFNLYNYITVPYNLGIMLSQISLIFSVFLLPPLLVGHSGFSLKIYKGITTSVNYMFSSGFDNYWRKVGGILWMQLFIFLWSLLFIIPGIIKSYAYFMTPYILADSKNVSATEALKISMRMTKGYKGEIFVMQLSFFGWFLLNALTFGLLGILYVSPYMYTSLAGLYEELKQDAIESGVILAEELA